ncbi:MAG: hypothetical protein Q9225_004898 [Loekoesia sp. 1 TL-2023]
MQYGLEETKKRDPLASTLQKLESMEQRVTNDLREQTKNLTGLSIFGMNVDVLSNDPPLKWYFMSSVPFMALLLAATVALRKISFSKIRTRIRRVLKGTWVGGRDDVLQEEDYGRGNV